MKSHPFFMVAAIAAAALAGAVDAHAHNLGRSLFAHTVIADVGTESLRVEYEIEIPTPVVMRRYFELTRRVTEDLTREEMDRRFTREMMANLEADLLVRWRSEPVALTVAETEDGTTGLGNLQFFRYKLVLTGAVDDAAAEPAALAIRNGNFVGQPAVFRTEIRAAEGLEVREDNLPAMDDPSKYLVDEVTGLRWSQSEAHRAVEAEIGKRTLGGQLRAFVSKGSEVAASSKYVAGAAQGEGALFEAVRSGSLTPGVVWGALFLSFGLGAGHALSPGHGKTLVAAYLVGSRGTIPQAFLLGGVVTFTHVFTVIVLGILALVASEYFVPEKLTPVLGTVSGLLIVGVGLVMLRRAVRTVRVHPHHHDHAHDHGHTHAHAHAHDHEHDHHHDHGEDGHTHMPEDGKVTLGNLLTLGVSGGMVPCPSAMVVMLTAIALGRIGFGLALVVTFSIGLALVLIAIGVVTVTAKGLLDRFGGGATERLTKVLPMVSGTVVTALGVQITWKSAQLIGRVVL